MKKVVSLLSMSVLLLGACSSSTSKEEAEPSANRAKTGQNKVEQIREQQRQKMKEREKEKEEEGNDDEEDTDEEDSDEE